MTEKIVRLGMEHIDEIMEFEKICFPCDSWEESEMAYVLNDIRAIYLDQLDNDRIISNIFCIIGQG